MTQEKYQTLSKASKLNEEVSIIRRSRSLSELPGNLRVPILRRGDTERTQARLEAGAAGVKELRVLREQQQQLFDQTMATVQQKRKPQRRPRPTADHHRLHYQQTLDHSKQQMHSCYSSLSTWHSTSSLTSISEEWDCIPKTSANKHCTGNTMNVPDCSIDQDNSPKADDNKNILKTSVNPSNSSLHIQQFDYHKDHNKRTSGHSFQQHDPQKQYHFTTVNHPQDKKFKSSIIKTEGLTSTDKKTMAQYDEFAFKTSKSKYMCSADTASCLPPTQDIMIRSRSASQDYFYDREHMKLHNPSNLYQRQNIVFAQSDQDHSRGRSRSVHDNFLHFTDTKENNCKSKLGHQNGIKNDMSTNLNNNYLDNNYHLSRSKHLQDLKSKANINCMEQYTTAGINTNVSQQKYLYNLTNHTQSTPYEKKTPPFLMPSVSLQARVKSQSISWDNLLVEIGLQNENSASTNETIEDEQESNDEVFINVVKHPPDSKEETWQSAQKKMRSQSFTDGYSLNQDSKYVFLKKEDSDQDSHRKQKNFNVKKNKNEDNGLSKMVLRHLNEHQQQVTDETYSTSLLRRASIQCEAVLTQTNTPRKIVNPLQDVDISSLQSPGPLHAVTLQYSSIPLKKTDKLDCDTFMVSSNSPVPEEKLIPAKTVAVSYTIASKHASHSFHSSLHSQSSTVTSNAMQVIHEKSRAAMKEPCHSKMVLQSTCSQKERPIPRPRTSILKGSQEVIPRTRITGSGTSREHNKLLNETTKQEENGFKSDNHLQSTDISDLSMSNSNSSILATSLVNTQNILCSNSALEHENSLSRNENNSITSKISSCIIPQNSELNCSQTELDKVELIILNEQNRNINTAEKYLSVNIYCPSNDKTAFCTNDGVDNVNKTIIPCAPSVSDKVHFTDGTSQIQSKTAQEENNDKMPKVFFLPQKYLSHTPEISMLSDDGYSTCESINQQSQLANNRHNQSCDMSSIGSDSATSMSFVRDIISCSSDKCSQGFQKNCEQSNTRSSNLAKSKVKDEHSSENNSRTHQPNARPSTATKGINGDKYQLNDKQNNTLLTTSASNQVPRNRTTALNYNFPSIGKETTVDLTELSNQKTSTKDFSASYGNTKTSNDDHYNDTVLKLERSRQICEEITPAAKQSNDLVKNSVFASTQSFRQTAV